MRIIDIPVNFRLGAALMVPLLVLTFISGDKLIELYSSYQRMLFLVELSEDVTEMGDLIHTLQVERGTTAGYLGSKGARLSGDLTTARTDTDKAIIGFNKARKSIERTHIGEHIAIATDANKALLQITEKRQQVSNLSLTGSQSFDYYNNLIDQLLNLTSRITLENDNARITINMIAYNELLMAKELAGQERGIGAGVIAAGSFDEPSFSAFVASGGAQQALLNQFISIQPIASQAELRNKIDQSGDDGFSHMRLIMAETGVGHSLAALDGTKWFSQATDRINTLKNVEETQIHNIQQMATSIAATTKAEFVKFLIFALAAVLIAIAVSVMLAISVTLPLRLLAKNMMKLAQGSTEIELKCADGKDEIGQMGLAVQAFIDSTKDNIEAQRLRDEETASEQSQSRREMMQQLRTSFGKVVDAAIAGDFAQRVPTDFPDDALNQLASSVNNLVSTVERGVSETGQVLSALAVADLTKRMEGNYQGAFAELKNDTNLVAEKLTDIVGQLRDTSGGLKTATGEILEGANDLSSRTTKQAATIEETSAAMEQLATTVLENANRAQKARSDASEARKTAERGGEIMADATNAMVRIKDSSTKISDIIGLIDDIAFQTNLLALNASVEAARAGEAGKGFAVVAIEVRRLAQSAAEASSEVKQLIDQSVTEVEGGSKHVTEAAQYLDGIVSSVRGMTDLMNEIADESKDQAGSIDELNQAVRQMDEMTQHNAALVEQTNAAIEQTESQANELDRIVDIFTLNKKPRAATTSTSPASDPKAESTTNTTGNKRQSDKPSAKPNTVRRLQTKVSNAAKAYLSNGNAAVSEQTEEWSEF